ncbi:MAG: UDPglucose--hexose-1-phosphate uridylyltransferase, partial [Candidatus Krumholzibacteriia bacterium]
ERRAKEYLTANNSCIVCDMVTAELEQKDRIVACNDDWLCLTPWASRFPWELLFVPRRHNSTLMQAQDHELRALAEVISPALKKLFKRHGDLSLNIVVHNASLGATGEVQNAAANHWHLEVLPRLSRPAGFEVGTGYAINAVVPEDAARWLREDG